MATATRVYDLGSGNGQVWSFQPGEATGKTTPAWRAIEVPAGGWKTQGHTCAQGRYRTSLHIPRSAAGGAVELHFDAINFGAEVLIGADEHSLRPVAQHVGGWMPVDADLTPHVQPGRTYLLEVRVQGRDCFRRKRLFEVKKDGVTKLEEHDCITIPEAAIWQPALADGILRGVSLRVYPGVAVQDVYVRTSVAADTIHPQATLRNVTNQSVRGVLRPRLKGDAGRSWNYPRLPEIPFALEPGETRTFDLRATAWRLGPTSYWWPNVPYQPGYRAVLHHLELTVEVDGRTTHRTATRFGFREFSVQGNRYLLNGIPCNLRGDNQQEANFGTDAYGIHPGFGQPTRGNAGWPGAVDNLLKLNFNVLRIHQVPGTPYMLDVCDEMGLMIVDETAVRGSEQREDFFAGWDHMLTAAADLARRDRRHPCIVLWSAANEIWKERTLALALSGAIRRFDDTRPVIIDGVDDMGPDIINMQHYTSGLGQFPDKGGTPRTDRPYGETESIWPADNCMQGFAWMGTSTLVRRLKGNADIRNYVLNNAWPNYVPGQSRKLQALEEAIKQCKFAGVEFDTEILPDIPQPWKHPNLLLIQRCYHPLAAVDLEFLEANKLSDKRGRYPVVEPTLGRDGRVRRQIAVFNDTLTSPPLELRWQVRHGSARGKTLAAGRMPLTIAPGAFAKTTIEFTTPRQAGRLVLVLETLCAGRVAFRDDLTRFRVK